MENHYKLFLDIQISKYLNENNKIEFEDEEQKKLVFEKITSRYNEVVAPDTLRLNNLIE